MLRVSIRVRGGRRFELSAHMAEMGIKVSIRVRGGRRFERARETNQNPEKRLNPREGRETVRTVVFHAEEKPPSQSA